ncbi:diguanylate cyclase [Sulfurimonas sp.]|uniref:GGDEF domain-containing response regulator n=1 Tax=Sulfurimonas sp. TaxID=2022749 RepID=UPI002AB17C5B|nr:diguanylate cyclase [Sulfurimonas sp.]
MKKILIVDDSQTILLMLESVLNEHPKIEPFFCKSYKDTQKLLKEHKGEFHAALLDLNLPDAPDGEVVDLVNTYNIPSIVLTGTLNKRLLETIQKKDVVDVILKNDKASIKFAIAAIQRTLKNYDTTALVVDDVELYRNIIKKSLKKINLNVLEAKDGQEALDILQKREDITLVITDYDMPIIDGLDLTFKIREKYNKDQVSIIAVSGLESKDIVSKFLKFGANDFIHKPFTHSEIVTRVNSNLELLDLFSRIKELGNTDYLTGAYNRRYFFQSGNAIFSKAKRKNKNLSVATIDIDKFKNINDIYGHDVGDDALKEVKTILDENLRESDLMARFGGEEFCILLEDISLEHTNILFEKIRKCFEANMIETHGIIVSYTVSIGIYFGMANSLEEIIKISDKALFEAKENGRNKVIIYT